MKATLECPKCGGRKLWRIEKVRMQTYNVAPMPIAVAWHKYAPHGFFEAFICRACRYSELYADGIADLVADPAQGVHEIDNQPKPDQGPMR